jgi:hypothetical protein
MATIFLIINLKYKETLFSVTSSSSHSMPSLLKIKVIEARDLPPGDDASVDAFVEIRLLGIREEQQQLSRTPTFRKSLNPEWRKDFFFEVVDDSSLQYAPIEFKVFDQEFSSNELIGTLYVDLNPLIMLSATRGSDKDLLSIQGWFPLYDTMKGIRGSLNIQVKLEPMSKSSKARESSFAVQFFNSSKLSPDAFVVQELLGFVVDLVVKDDAESTWKDYFFQSGQSSKNDDRLKIMFTLSCKVRHELAKKAIELGGNAILGYSVHFDVEGASGIVARAYGTACKLLKVVGSSYLSTYGSGKGSTPSVSRQTSSELHAGIQRQPSTELQSSKGEETVFSFERSESSIRGLHDQTLPLSEMSAATLQPTSDRLLICAQDADIGQGLSMGSLNSPSRSSPSDRMQILVPFGPNGDRGGQFFDLSSGVGASVLQDLRSDFGVSAEPGMSRKRQYNTEILLLSLTKLDPHIRIHLGGLVITKSVKFLGKLETTLSDQETRESWWEELREDIRKHAKTLCCTHVVGYSETCTIYGEVCVLSAIGTAAVIKADTHPEILKQILHSLGDEFEEVAHDEEVSRKRSVSTDGNSSKNVSYSGGELTSDIPIVTSVPFSARRDSGDDESLKIAASPNQLKVAITKSSKIQSPLDLNRQQSADSIRSINLKADCQKRLNKKVRSCYSAHVPYNRSAAPFGYMRLVPCELCKRKWVAETILSTTEPHPSLPIKGKGQFLEARMIRSRKSATGEVDAVKISDILPFVEYELQRQIMLKLKIFGMNAAYGYTTRFQVGKNMVIATATCTAVYVSALPPPPKIVRGQDTSKEFQSLQQNIEILIDVIFILYFSVYTTIYLFIYLLFFNNDVYYSGTSACATSSSKRNQHWKKLTRL